MFISYNVINDKQFDKTIQDAIKEVSDLRAPFRLIANDFYLSQQVIFRLKSAGGYPDFKGPKIGERRNGPLQRPTPGRNPIPNSFDSYTPYQYYKEKATGFQKGYPLLKRSGALERATTSGNSPDSILVIGKETLEIGTDLPYADIHQQGGPIIPQRKILFIGPESRQGDEPGKASLAGRLDRWTKIIDNFVTRTTQNRLK